MQPQERELISGLFDRLRTLESQPRDPEVEKLIADRTARQPAAPYLLAQTVLVQEQALKAAQDRIADLEGRPRGSFAETQAEARGSGFLGTALSTAAGVAGGMLMFEGLRSLLSHNPGPFGRSIGDGSTLLGQDLGPPSHLTSADLAQDEGAADDYDMTDDNSGFDDI